MSVESILQSEIQYIEATFNGAGSLSARVKQDNVAAARFQGAGGASFFIGTDGIDNRIVYTTPEIRIVYVSAESRIVYAVLEDRDAEAADDDRVAVTIEESA